MVFDNPTQRKVLIVRWGDNLSFATPGGGTTWSYYELDDLERIKELGPYIEQIIPHNKTKTLTANAEWKLVFYWSVDGASWTGPLDLFTAITTAGQSIATPYTTTANFGLQMRWAVGVRANAGTASEAATVGGSLALVFRS